ncbi:MAG: ABC transporter ATP-binding protein [Rhodovibrionaceae bacterium]|nr:ABC transporter ATP-binding protein [Rhodovibrionaceae bacterium]
MTQQRFPVPPRRVQRTGDDTPATSYLQYVLRMSGRRHQAALGALAVIVAALSMAPLELQRRIVDDAIAKSDLRMLAWCAGLYLAVLLLQGGLKYLMRVYQGWLGESAARYTRRHVAKMREKHPNDAQTAGKAVSVIGNEIDEIGTFVGEAIADPLVNAGMLVAMLGYMIVVQPVLALICLAFMLPQVAIVPVLQRRINEWVDRRVDLMRELSDEVEGGSGSDSEEFRGSLRDIYDARMRIYALKYGSKAAVNFLNALAPLSVLAVGGYMAIQGQTTVGIIVAFVSGFERVGGPLRQLIVHYRRFAQIGVMHRRIAEWIC